MTTFRYHSEIIAEFPNLRAAVLIIQGLRNHSSPAALLDLYHDEQNSTLERIGDGALSEIKSLASWRRAFRLFGVNPTKYRSAPEALLRRLTKKGDIPSINTLVDISNMVSIRYALPVASMDTRSINGTLTVRFSAGSVYV